MKQINIEINKTFEINKRACSIMDSAPGFGPDDRGSIPRRLILTIPNLLITILTLFHK